MKRKSQELLTPLCIRRKAKIEKLTEIIFLMDKPVEILCNVEFLTERKPTLLDNNLCGVQGKKYRASLRKASELLKSESLMPITQINYNY